MKKSTVLLLGAAFICGTALITSCKDKEGENGGVDEVLTPEQSKEYLQNTANMLVEKLEPANQRKLMDFAQNFVSEYEDYYFPIFDDYDDEMYDDRYNSATPMKIIYKALHTGDYVALTRAFDEYVFDFENYAGVYEANPREEEFTKIKDSKDQIVIRCTVNGKNSELVAQKSGGNWSYVYEEEYDDCRYKVNVPEKVTFTLTYGGEQLASAEVVSHYNPSAKTADVSSSFKSENLSVSEAVTMTNSQLKSSAKLSVSGSEILATEATVNGSNLCDIEKIMAFYEKFDEGDLRNPWQTIQNQFLKDGNSKAKLLDRVTITGSAKEVSLLAEAFDVDTYYSSSSESSTVKKKVQGACDIINQNLIGNIYFTGSDKVQAKLAADLKQDKSDYSDYGYWDIVPVIVFESDGTKYLFDHYFSENNFSGVITSFENLAKRWEAFFDPY